MRRAAPRGPARPPMQREPGPGPAVGIERVGDRHSSSNYASSARVLNALSVMPRRRARPTAQRSI